MAKDPIIVDPDPIREIQKAINNIRKEF